MNITQQSFKSILFGLGAIVALLSLHPALAQAGNVALSVSVGGGYPGPYGGGWRPAAYGPGWGAWGPAWRGGYYGPRYIAPYGAAYYSAPVVYATPPVVAYVSPPQPVVLASQAQPTFWYYCQASGQYFPYVQSCSSGWQTQQAMPPAPNPIVR